ncbi:hypothetical protein PVAND_015274 [Polypedilum vanderplanki]|uniref:Uncharacterized protein n=1 Tax=Polypedilum vanderplanki TaxID=319348 RepID=A0A9J6BCJ6_POLVA|nr:hypothetical protein PVAND_015274 [Polypedilum vanderplanki]
MENLGLKLKEANRRFSDLQDTVDNQLAELAVLRANAKKPASDDRHTTASRKFLVYSELKDFEKDSPASIECKSFKKKTVAERQQFVDSKSLCNSCIISSDNTASQCQLKKQLWCSRFNPQMSCFTSHYVHNKGTSQISSNKSKVPGSNGGAQKACTSSSYQRLSVTNNKSGTKCHIPNGYVVLTATQTVPITESSPKEQLSCLGLSLSFNWPPCSRFCRRRFRSRSHGSLSVLWLMHLA